jgi:hypothetical protein
VLLFIIDVCWKFWLTYVFKHLRWAYSEGWFNFFQFFS